MERRGSGFKKIKKEYRRSIYYRSDVEPLFRSTPTSFFVILYNLNYNVPEKEVLIDPKKELIDLENVSIHNAINKLNANQATKEKTNLLFEKMGFDKIFGRKEIMETINISVTAAGNLLNHLKNAGLIKAVKGFGKGKYQFVRQNEVLT